MTDTSIHSAALGLATKNSLDEIIEVFFPEPVLAPDSETMALVTAACTMVGAENAFAELDSTSTGQLAAELQGKVPES